MERRILEIVSTITQLERNSISVDSTFEELGIKSVFAVELALEIERLLNRVIPVTIAYDYPTVSSLAKFLEQNQSINQKISLGLNSNRRVFVLSESHLFQHSLHPYQIE